MKIWCVLTGLTTVLIAASGSTASAGKGATPQCFGEDATIVGTSARETIRGTPGPDVILGGGGGPDGGRGDKILGLGGDDRICGDPTEPVYSVFQGGSGDDRILGSGVIVGGPGADTLVNPTPVYLDMILIGGAGNDVLRSQIAGSVDFTPGPGDDVVVSAPHADGAAVYFRAANHGVVVDLRRGTAVGQGHDSLKAIVTVYGSPHADVILGDGRNNFIKGLNGDDVLIGGVGRDPLFGGPGDDRVDGGRDNDYLFGGRGRDALSGRAGDDELFERRGPEPNLILGGPGKDRCHGGYRIPPNVEQGCESH